MTDAEKRHYWVLGIEDDINGDMDEYDTEELRDSIVLGLENKFKYISVINEYGENVYEKEGHKTESFDDVDWIKVLDENGELDIEATADAVLKDFLDNHAIIAFLFEKDQYDELGDDTTWIDGILEDEE